MILSEYLVLAGFAVLFIWGWRRVYRRVIRKGGRPFIAHLLGILLAFFPARFFVMAVTALLPVEGRVHLSDARTIILWLIFILSVLGMYFLTRKKESTDVTTGFPSGSGKVGDGADRRKTEK